MMKSKIVSTIALVLALVMCIAPMASAAVYASNYINFSGATINKVGIGKVKISFEVTGAFGVNEAGAKKVVVYESPDGSTWTAKKTFYSSTTPGMITYGSKNATSSVTYSGRSGYYYYAEVTVYAGISGTGDTDLHVTGSVKA